jgi:hypothetical protein
MCHQTQSTTISTAETLFCSWLLCVSTLSGVWVRHEMELSRGYRDSAPPKVLAPPSQISQLPAATRSQPVNA